MSMLNKTIEKYREALVPYQENRDYVKRLCEALSLLRVDVKATVKSLERHYCGAFYVSLYEDNDALFNLLYESMMNIFSQLHGETLSQRYQENFEIFDQLASDTIDKAERISLKSRFESNRDYQFQGYLKKGQSVHQKESEALRYPLPEEVQRVIKRISGLRDYIRIFRGSRTNVETERFFKALEYNLYHVGARDSQVRAIKAQTAAWLKWMRNIYGEHDTFCLQIADLSAELLLAIESAVPDRVVH